MKLFEFKEVSKPLNPGIMENETDAKVVDETKNVFEDTSSKIEEAPSSEILIFDALQQEISARGPQCRLSLTDRTPSYQNTCSRLASGQTLAETKPPFCHTTHSTTGHGRVQGSGSRIKPVNVDLNSSMFTDRNKSPEVNEVEAEDSDVEKVYEVKEEDVENKNSTEFGT